MKYVSRNTAIWQQQQGTEFPSLNRRGADQEGNYSYRESSYSGDRKYNSQSEGSPVIFCTPSSCVLYVSLSTKISFLSALFLSKVYRYLWERVNTVASSWHVFQASSEKNTEILFFYLSLKSFSCQCFLELQVNDLDLH